MATQRPVNSFVTPPGQPMVLPADATEEERDLYNTLEAMDRATCPDLKPKGVEDEVQPERR